MSKTLGTQHFARALRKAAPANQEELAAFMAANSGEAAAKTATRTLVNYTIAAINRGDTVFKLRELFPAVDEALSREEIATPGTRANANVMIRDAAKQKHGEDSAIYAAAKAKLSDDKKHFGAVIKATAEKLIAKTTNPTKIKWAEIKALIAATREAKKPADLVIMLQLATGARFGEITRRSTFEALPDGKVRQIGIEKSKSINSVEKELLFLSAAEFFARFTALRTALTATSDSAITMAVARRLKSLGMKIGMAERITSHDLRRIYALTSWQVFRKSETVVAWIASRLGHDSTTTAAHYMTINVELSPEDIEEIRAMNAQAAPAAPAAPAAKEAKQGPAAATAAEAKQPHATDAPGPPQQPRAASAAAAAAPVIPHNIRKRDGKAMERLSETVAALEAAGMRYSQKTLKGYGYSSTTINDWYKAHKVAAA